MFLIELQDPLVPSAEVKITSGKFLLLLAELLQSVEFLFPFQRGVSLHP